MAFIQGGTEGSPSPGYEREPAAASTSADTTDINEWNDVITVAWVVKKTL